MRLRNLEYDATRFPISSGILAWNLTYLLAFHNLQYPTLARYKPTTNWERNKESGWLGHTLHKPLDGITKKVIDWDPQRSSHNGRLTNRTIQTTSTVERKQTLVIELIGINLLRHYALLKSNRNIYIIYIWTCIQPSTKHT